MKKRFLAFLILISLAVVGCVSTPADVVALEARQQRSYGIELPGTKWGMMDYNTLIYSKDDVDYIIRHLTIAPKRVAMFIIPVNNEAANTTYKGFELKASTNNFSHSTSEFIRLQYYSQSQIASTGSTEGGGIDKMKLFVCTSKDSDDPRKYRKIEDTAIDWTNALTSVVVLVDTSCLIRHPEIDDEWLLDGNEELIWCYLRIRINDPRYECENGTSNPLWRPIAPVRWFSEMPKWAVDQE